MKLYCEITSRCERCLVDPAFDFPGRGGEGALLTGGVVYHAGRSQLALDVVIANL